MVQDPSGGLIRQPARRMFLDTIADLGNIESGHRAHSYSDDYVSIIVAGEQLVVDDF